MRLTGLENPVQLELDAVRSDLELVKGCLMHPGDLDGAAMMESGLENVAARLRALTAEPDRIRGLGTASGASVLQDILDTRLRFREVERLFWNARSLQEGWLRLAFPAQGGSYDSTGNRESSVPAPPGNGQFG